MSIGRSAWCTSPAETEPRSTDATAPWPCEPAMTTAASRVSAVAASTRQAAEPDSTASPRASSPAGPGQLHPFRDRRLGRSRAAHVSKSPVTSRISATGAPLSARPLTEWRNGDSHAWTTSAARPGSSRPAAAIASRAAGEPS